MRNRQRLFLSVIGCLLCVLALGCAQPDADNGAKYFASPSAAVEQMGVMLEEKNWPELARYYDLSDSPENRADLISGEFFYTEDRPEAAHPAGFWKYKHPFAPPFKFESTRPLEAPGVIEVTVAVEIDQGGGPLQRSMQSFLMRKSDKGYQVMPHKAPVF